MTANQGPGVPDELRERLIRRMQLVSVPVDLIADDRACSSIEVDAILAEIAAAGYRIVPGDRLERLIYAATEGVACILERDGATMVPFHAVHLQPGDLDPLDPVAVGEGQS